MSGYPPNQPPPNQYPQSQPPPNQYPQGQYPQPPPPPYAPNQYQQQNPYYQQHPYQQNPYAAASLYVPCPRCQTPDPKPVKFTWWGGLLGPKLLKHVECQRCNLAYNGKSGQSNTTGIVIYSVVVAVIVVVIFGLIAIASS